MPLNESLNCIHRDTICFNECPGYGELFDFLKEAWLWQLSKGYFRGSFEDFASNISYVRDRGGRAIFLPRMLEKFGKCYGCMNSNFYTSEVIFIIGKQPW